MQFGDEKNNLIILQSYFFNILIIQALRKYNTKNVKLNFCELNEILSVNNLALYFRNAWIIKILKN